MLGTVVAARPLSGLRNSTMLDIQSAAIYDCPRSRPVPLPATGANPKWGLGSSASLDASSSSLQEAAEIMTALHMPESAAAVYGDKKPSLDMSEPLTMSENDSAGSHTGFDDEDDEDEDTAMRDLPSLETAQLSPPSEGRKRKGNKPNSAGSRKALATEELMAEQQAQLQKGGGIVCSCGRVFPNGRALGGHRGKCKVPRVRLKGQKALHTKDGEETTSPKKRGRKSKGSPDSDVEGKANQVEKKRESKRKKRAPVHLDFDNGDTNGEEEYLSNKMPPLAKDQHQPSSRPLQPPMSLLTTSPQKLPPHSYWPQQPLHVHDMDRRNRGRLRRLEDLSEREGGANTRSQSRNSRCSSRESFRAESPPHSPVQPTCAMKPFDPIDFKLGQNERHAQTPACIVKVYNFRLALPEDITARLVCWPFIDVLVNRGRDEGGRKAGG